MKHIYSTLFAILSLNYFSYGQNSPVNQPAAGIISYDNFTYNGYTVSHYGLGWYQDPNSSTPASAYLSAYSGFKFFTAGTPKGVWDVNGNLGIGTLTPEQRLTVQMDGSSNGNGIAVKAITNSGAGSQPAFVFLNNSGGKRMYNYLDIYTDTYNIANAANSPLFSLTQTGNVGIGTTNPGYKLDVSGVINSNSYMSNLQGIYVDGGTATGINSTAGLLAFRTNSVDNRMVIDVNGNVGIGTSTPREALSVNGRIRSKEVNVTTANWPDFVFKKEYKLPSLLEVKNFIDANHHLPDVPSEQEVKDNGLNLGEINKILTKKVEELTLYLIDKDKQLSEQQKQINELKEQVNAIIQKQKSTVK